MSNEKMRDELTAMANDLRHNEDVDYVDIADRLDELALSAQASAEPVAYRVTVEFMGNTRHYLTDSVVVAEAIEEHRQGVLQPLYTHPPRAAGPVAYLDIGAGGYIDIGSDLSDDVLMKLPKGRHMLTIVGTYGIDGYVPVEPPRAASPVVPEAIEPDDAPEMIPDDEEDMKNAYADGWNACRQALLATSAPSGPKRAELTDEFYCYDAGLLNDFGGGNVEWWQDYMRAELARAHEFYQSQMPHQSAGDAWSDGYKHAHYEFGAALRSLEQILSRKPLDIPGALMVIKSQRAVIAAHDKANGLGGV